jgi:hypothetical protein
MKTLNLSEHLDEIFEQLTSIALSDQACISWQLKHDGTRLIKPVVLSSVDLGQQDFILEASDAQDFNFEVSTLYFYLKSHQIILKSKVVSVESGAVVVKFPTDMKCLG